MSGRPSVAAAAVAALALARAPRAAADLDVGVDPDYAALPCRPTIACTADLVPPGVLEVEAGYLYRRLAGAVDQSSTPFLVKLTLVEWAQLQLGSNGVTFADGPVEAADARTFDDLLVGVKLHLRDQSARAPSVALSAVVSAPTPAAAAPRTWDLLATAYVTKDLGWLHVDGNVGASWWALGAGARAQAWAALALSAPLGRGLGVMLEGYGFGDAAPYAPRDAGVLAALSWQPRPWLVLDAGPDVGLVHATRVASAFVGVTVLVLDLWDTDRERAR